MCGRPLPAWRRVAGPAAARARGWSVPSGTMGERAGGARGGATAVLRGTPARARKIVSLMGADAVPHRASRAVGAVALPRGLAGGRARRAKHDAAVGPRRARHARRGARWSGAAPGAGRA